MILDINTQKSARITRAIKAFEQFENEIDHIRKEQKSVLIELERELSEKEMENIKKRFSLN